jgi:hypothetical protein
MKKPVLVPLICSLWDIKRLLIFILIFVSILIFSRSKASAQQVTFSDTYFTTHQKDSSFTIKVPDYLVEVSDLCTDASFQFKNIFNETYMIIVPETKTVEGHHDLDQLNTDFESNLLLKGGFINSSKKVSIGNCAAIQNIAEWSVEGKTLAYVITFIDTPEVLYKIYCWTLASQKEYVDDFIKTSNSFALKNSFRSHLRFNLQLLNKP